ncbi:hypothetical protein A2Z10_01425 [Candidatus Azambacteria bacterium RBG_16_47_10]|uniref:Uncharacterized protein n=1 Tax=Candidatus Azambacteria bacterium RBG_16_47_10 TaxID=1797292 RepID=A0A1F5AY49_9BACT|nr:MAG: hypothetical protein A2Z10_01425 [Candidatus Azambacteria bacterium RBG_16_47_10]
MKIQTQSIFRFFEQGAAQMRRHIYVVLLLLFVAAMVLDGFIFWQYGYRVSLQEPEVTVRSVIPKEGELRTLIEKGKGRDASRDAIFEKVLYDPFIQPEKVQ